MVYLRPERLEMSKKWSKEGRRLAGMNKELLTKLKHKLEVYRRWKQGPSGVNMGMLSECGKM